MVKKLLCCVVLVMVLASGAFGEAEMWFDNNLSIASLKDGKPDYSDARFSYTGFSIGNNDLILTRDNMSLTGSVTISGGNYSFWNGKEMQKVSGTPQTFKLALPTWSTIGSGAEFYPFTDSGSELRFCLEADGGLNGATVSWNFPDSPSMNGTYTVPHYLTTQEQLENHVVYFEFIRSGENVTGINWRVVKASDTSKPVSLDFPVQFRRLRVWNFDEERIVDLKPSFYIEAGQIPEGVLMFDDPIKESDIWNVMTKFYTYDEPVEKGYLWHYYAPSEPASLYLWIRHASDASLVNGKSDYSTAKFSDVAFYLPNSSPVIAEAKYFTDAGRVTIPNGEYTLKDADTGETLSTVTGNTALKLKFDAEGTVGGEYLEYHTVNDNGRFVALAGRAETDLNGKKLTWTFPAELNLDGSGTVPNYKSTAQQLASGVPYIELVSEDGYVTAVKYKIVTASDTSTAITPAYRTDFTFYFDRNEGLEGSSNSYMTDRLRNVASGTYTLDVPQPLNTVKRVRVRFRSYEGSDNPDIYQWNFYPASAPAPITITTSTLPSAASGTYYTVTLAANVPGVSWRVSSGALPEGLSLNSSTGTISGTPTTLGRSTFKVTAEMPGYIGAEKQFNLTVRPPITQTIWISTRTVPQGVVGMSYNTTLVSSPSGATWTLTGNLPAGLTLDSSGRISGTPTVSGSFPFTVTASYSTASRVRDLTLTVNPLKITTASLPGGTVGDAYNQTISSNGSGLTWTVNAGALPAGLTLNENNGVLSGTLTEAGDYTFTVYAYNTYASASKQFTVKVQGNGSSGGGGGGCNGLAGLAAIASLAFFLRKR
ncbi:MAG: putative Ig domain-containing protein [Synergistaceae bacterium]|nr:putative Ig domain-containing protein [Synergistaceae bacterium]